MTSSQIQRAESQTHEHLLSIVHTEIHHHEDAGQTIRILDVGCGDGHMMAYLMKNLPILNPSRTFDMYGFDVHDHGVQHLGYFKQSEAFLSSRIPEVDWTKKLNLIPSTSPWPYPENYFDVIISNQVLEHVRNHEFFFSELYRTLQPGGFSVHLFPLYHSIIESHIWLPFVHQTNDFNRLRSAIKAWSKLGFGKYSTYKREGMLIDEFAERNADFVYFYTNYLRAGEVLRLAKKYRLRGSFKYTQEYYWRKLAAISKLKPTFQYSNSRFGLADILAVSFLKFVSSVTLFLEKKETYTSRN